MALLEARNISVSFDNNKILDNVSISLNKGELVSILGASGSGKTTLFNIIAGLIMPSCGSVSYKDTNITGKSGYFGYMLQKDLLMPHKTIMDNVALPIILKGLSKRDAYKQVEPFFQEFGLDGTQTKYPAQLSGGMRQRVALLRTYMFSGEIALLDEPFSALDTITKSNMHKWYMNIIEQIGLSTLFITHDIDEAILLSDRIYILSGTPATVSHEIIISSPDVRTNNLMLSENFLKYKKTIIKAIGDS